MSALPATAALSFAAESGPCWRRLTCWQSYRCRNSCGAASPTTWASRRALPLAAALEGAAVPVSYTVGIQPGHRGRNVLRRKAIGRSLGSPLVRQHRKGGGRKLLSSLDVQPLGLLTQAGLKVPRGKVMSSMPDVSSSENTSRQAFGRPCFETRLLASRRPRAASGVLRKRSVSFL